MFLCTPQVVGKPDIGIEFTDRKTGRTNYRQQPTTTVNNRQLPTTSTQLPTTSTQLPTTS
jgi:hypothetical protein